MNPLSQANAFPPGPRGHWLLGSLSERKKAPLSLYLNTALSFGKVSRIRLGNRFIYLLCDPEAIKHVLMANQANYSKGFIYNFLTPLLGQGLLTSEGEFWRRQRRLSQPAFHRQRLRGLGQMMTNRTEKMLSEWDVLESRQEPIDALTEMMRLTLGIASQTLLGKDVSDEADVVGRSLSELLEESNRRILSVIPGVERLPTARNRRFQQSLERLNRVVYGVIEERRQNPGKHGDLLEMLMEAKDEGSEEGMTDKQLRDEVMTIFLAGHETTANALAWTWYLLSKHPEIARKARVEVECVLEGRAPTVEDLPQLKYLGMIFEESLRLYPPAWAIARQATKDDEILGYRVPSGAIMVISAYVMHRLPQFWSNPEGFDPERFRPEQVELRPKYSYIPFGGGPRQCIGNNFAMMEAQLIMACVIQKFKLHLVPGHPIEPEALITLRPKHGIKMNLQKV